MDGVFKPRIFLVKIFCNQCVLLFHTEGLPIVWNCVLKAHNVNIDGLVCHLRVTG